MEVFLSGFANICRVNGWTKDAATMHLRNCLVEEASPCQRHEDMGDEIEDLRTRLREAKRLLRALRQGGRSYHHLGDEVASLVDLVYGPEGTDAVQVEQFSMAVNDVEVRTYLLIKDPATLRVTIYEANDFVSVRGKPEKAVSVNAVERQTRPSFEGQRMAALEKKFDSLVGVMTEMLRRGTGQQYQLPNPSQKALPAPPGPAG